MRKRVVELVLPELDIYPHGHILWLKPKSGIFVDKKNNERVVAKILRVIPYGGVTVAKIQLDRARTVPFWVRAAKKKDPL